ncbi:hypothetical protein [Nocardiopsis metallicus]|uniref:Uncharacterized protein n=1 Tax=Nocardiopsis metallicus TaxID=179819 RepID=A0A840WNV6_9ACTN|nr:hypothetical protein [Nocardiopsis metallicus]MBB5493465.1 hypothetical protein [Nocardiopsis metallicus]
MPRPNPIDLPGRKERSPRARVYLWFRDQPWLLWPLWVGTVTLFLCSIGLAPGAAYYWPRQYPITSDQSAILVYAGAAALFLLVTVFTAPVTLTQYPRSLSRGARDFRHLSRTLELVAELADRAERWADSEARRGRLAQIRELASQAEKNADRARERLLKINQMPRPHNWLVKAASYRWDITRELYAAEKLALEVHRFVDNRETGREEPDFLHEFQLWLRR